MKRPYLSEQERKLVRMNTISGSGAMLRLAFMRLFRAIRTTTIGRLFKHIFSGKQHKPTARTLHSNVTNSYSYMIRLDICDLDDSEFQVQQTYSNIRLYLIWFGLDIGRMQYSSFGDCYFIEVSGIYTGTVAITELNIPPSEFEWDKY